MGAPRGRRAEDRPFGRGPPVGRAGPPVVRHRERAGHPSARAVGVLGGEPPGRGARAGPKSAAPGRSGLRARSPGHRVSRPGRRGRGAGRGSRVDGPSGPQPAGSAAHPDLGRGAGAGVAAAGRRRLPRRGRRPVLREPLRARGVEGGSRRAGEALRAGRGARRPGRRPGREGGLPGPARGAGGAAGPGRGREGRAQHARSARPGDAAARTRPKNSCRGQGVGAAARLVEGRRGAGRSRRDPQGRTARGGRDGAGARGDASAGA